MALLNPLKFIQDNPDDLEEAMKVAAPQSASAVPEGTDEAVQLVAPKAEEKPALRPGMNLRELDSARLDAKNRELGSIEQLGGIKSEGAAKTAVAAGELESSNREGLDRARQRIDENRGQKAESERRAREHLDKVSKLVDEPPDASKGAVLRAIGAMMSGMGGGGLGAGLQMLGQSMAGDVNGWRAQIEAQGAAQNAFMKDAAYEQEDSEHELRVEKGLADLGFGVYKAAVDRVAAETSSEAEKAAAQQLSSALESKYLEAEYDREARRAAARAEAVRKQNNSQLLDGIYREISKGQTPEERAAIAGRFGKLGHTALQDMQKSDKGAADIQQTLANTAKAQAEAGKNAPDVAGSEVAGGYRIEKPEVWASLPAPAKANFSKAVGALPGLKATLTELRDLVAEYGTETLPSEAKSRMQALHADALGSIKEANELGALDNGVATLVAKQLGDPTAWNFGFGNAVENADVRIDQTLKAIDRNVSSKAAAYGLGPLAPPNAHGAGAGGSNYDPAFTPGQTSTPSAASRGVVRDSAGNVTMPDVNLNITEEEIAGIPRSWLK